MTDQETLDRWRADGCTCPVPRNRLHFADCPLWLRVLADVARVQKNHDDGVYDDE